MTPTSTKAPANTPTPTQGVVQLPSTGQGDGESGSNGARAVLLAAAGLVMLATALIAARRRPA